MDIIILISVVILLIIGIFGSIAPILPGPPFSYLALLLTELYFKDPNVLLLIITAFIVLATIFIDHFLQIYPVKLLGGGKYAIRGSILGMILGMFVLPFFGILIGAFIGAYVGSVIAQDATPMKIASGAFIGFVAGAILKLFVSCFITIYVILILLYI